MKTWNIEKLQEKLKEDLNLCTTNHEKIMVKAIGGKEIREFAIELAKSRKLTTREIFIASNYGFKG